MWQAAQGGREAREQWPELWILLVHGLAIGVGDNAVIVLFPPRTG
jgi:hypothetical protein